MGVSIISREVIKPYSNKKQISQIFRFRLFICIIVACAVAGIFTATLQTKMSKSETENVINLTQ